VKNVGTGEICNLNFRRRGWSKKTYGDIDGEVRDASGIVAYKLYGKWTDKIYMKSATDPDA
jgi:hypothetical protein